MKISSLVFGILLLCGAVGCGVKGDPVPPKEEITISKGAPVYKRSFEEESTDQSGILKKKNKFSYPAEDDYKDEEDEKRKK